MLPAWLGLLRPCFGLASGPERGELMIVTSSGRSADTGAGAGACCRGGEPCPDLVVMGRPSRPRCPGHVGDEAGPVLSVREVAHGQPVGVGPGHEQGYSRPVHVPIMCRSRAPGMPCSREAHRLIRCTATDWRLRRSGLAACWTAYESTRCWISVGASWSAARMPSSPQARSTAPSIPGRRACRRGPGRTHPGPPHRSPST